MGVMGILLAPRCYHSLDKYTVSTSVPPSAYPRTWTEFLAFFSTEEACLTYLETLHWPDGFVCPSCAVASAPVRTDGSAAYRSLTTLGFVHQRTVMLGSEVPAHQSMAGVHRVASLVKRWILGTHHGSVQPGHLDAYLDEFVFRLNRRTSGSRGMLFYRLLQQAVITNPVTYDNVVGRSITRQNSKEDG